MNRRNFIKKSSLVVGTTALSSSIMLNGTATAAAQQPMHAYPLLPQQENFIGGMLRRIKIFFEAGKYQWDYNPSNAQGVPSVKPFPEEQLPDVVWLLKFLNKIGEQANNTINSIPAIFSGQFEQRSGNQARALTTALQNVLNTIPNQRDSSIYSRSFLVSIVDAIIFAVTELLKLIALVGSTITDSAHLTEAQFKSLFASISLPSLVDDFESDQTFAQLRVAGVNPTLLKRITQLPEKFPLSNERYQSVMGNDDSLTRAANENRLFLLDYEELSDMIAISPNEKDLTGAGFSYAPIALFAIPRNGDNKLRPVAIQCDQDPMRYPIFTPGQGNSSQYWAWRMAKTVVSSADDLHHEFFTHLGYTHLIIEPIVIATHRTLSSNHPLYLLLKPHLLGTMFINHFAFETLLEERSFIDLLYQPDIEQIIGGMLTVRTQSYDFYQKMLPTDLANRGVLTSQELSYYPYRDDSLLIWDAIGSWCSDYVGIYYASDQQVINDSELLTWADEIRIAGKVTGFRRITSRDQLVEVLTMIIFTASAQHAAVNFPQLDLATYAPARTSILKAPAPTSQDLYEANQQSWEKMLPPIFSGLTRVFILSLLGGIYHGTLGEYIKPDGSDESQFNDPRILRVGGPLTNFQQNLADIEDVIDQRNRHRTPKYQYLKPSNIPVSTNI